MGTTEAKVQSTTKKKPSVQKQPFEQLGTFPDRIVGFTVIILSVLQRDLKTVCGWREGKGDDALTQALQPSCAPVLFMEPRKSSWRCSSHKKANKITLGAITCVAWPCCCSCCSCCAVRKLTGLFPAISFVPAGIVVRMIFLPNPLMLGKKNC